MDRFYLSNQIENGLISVGDIVEFVDDSMFLHSSFVGKKLPIVAFDHYTLSRPIVLITFFSMLGELVDEDFIRNNIDYEKSLRRCLSERVIVALGSEIEKIIRKSPGKFNIGDRVRRTEYQVSQRGPAEGTIICANDRDLIAKVDKKYRNNVYVIKDFAAADLRGIPRDMVGEPVMIVSEVNAHKYWEIIPDDSENVVVSTDLKKDPADEEMKKQLAFFSPPKVDPGPSGLLFP
jgi:hypothetical protein